MNGIRGLVRRGGEHDEPWSTWFVAPQTSETKDFPIGLMELRAAFFETSRENQTALVQVWFEGWQRGEGFALGVDEWPFVPRHLPTPAHFTTGQNILPWHDERSGIGGANASTRNVAENLLSDFAFDRGFLFRLRSFVIGAHGAGAQNLPSRRLTQASYVASREATSRSINSPR